MLFTSRSLSRSLSLTHSLSLSLTGSKGLQLVVSLSLSLAAGGAVADMAAQAGLRARSLASRLMVVFFRLARDQQLRCSLLSGLIFIQLGFLPK